MWRYALTTRQSHSISGVSAIVKIIGELSSQQFCYHYCKVVQVRKRKYVESYFICNHLFSSALRVLTLRKIFTRS